LPFIVISKATKNGKTFPFMTDASTYSPNKDHQKSWGSVMILYLLFPDVGTYWLLPEFTRKIILLPFTLPFWVFHTNSILFFFLWVFCMTP
jgi:hypothetical protein